MSVSETWYKAGEIAHKILSSIEKEIRPGKKVLELCEKIEQMIRDEGARPAFPANISINEVAAHYTSPPGDRTTIPNKALVKVDLGVLMDDGAIADTAITVGIGIDKKLVELIRATKEALSVAIEHVKAGVRVGFIGELIWKIAHDRGFGVLADLGGHSIDKWNLHSGITIPNVPRMFSPKLKENMIIAIEPFLIPVGKDSSTNPDMTRVFIFSIRNHQGDRILETLYKMFDKLPFTLRWIGKARMDPIFRERLERVLIEKFYEGRIRAYPTLIESERRWVSQFEHTILVKTNSAEILT